MGRIVGYFTVLVITVVGLCGCNSGKSSQTEFSVNGDRYQTNSFDKAQEQAVFRILKPDFTIIDPGKKAHLYIHGTMKDSIKSQVDRDISIHYASESNICCSDRFTLEHEPGSYDVLIIEDDDPRLDMPNMNIKEINGVKLGYRSEVRDGLTNNFVRFRCAGVFVSFTAYGGDIEMYLDLTKSMLPNRC